MTRAIIELNKYIVTLACIACISAFAAQPASLILLNPDPAPGAATGVAEQRTPSEWHISVAGNSYNPGKIKIFSVEPIYNEDGELTNDADKAAELRNASDGSWVLSGVNKKYWIIFYPRLGMLNLTVNLYKTGSQPGAYAKVRVTQAILKAIDKNGSSFSSKGFAFLSKLPGLGTLADIVEGASGNAVTMEVKVSETASNKLNPNTDRFEDAKDGPYLTLN